MSCLPGCGQPASASFAHAPGCPNVARHDAPPQPPPFTITNQHDAAPVTEERCPPHLWTWRQPPPSKFEEALAALEEFMRTRIYHEEADLERVKVEAVRAAHREAVEEVRHDKAQAFVDGVNTMDDFISEAAAKAHAAGVAEGRRNHAECEQVAAADYARGVAEGRREMAREALDQIAYGGIAEWLEARAGEEPTRG